MTRAEAIEQYRYVKAALKRAVQYQLRAEFSDDYRLYRAAGASPVTAAYSALYDWDLLDVVGTGALALRVVP